MVEQPRVSEFLGPHLLDEHGPWFIMGCPRSGTTFLSNCIFDIPGAEVFIEFPTPARIMHLIGYMQERKQPTEQLLKVTRELFWHAFYRRRLAFSRRLAAAAQRRSFLGLLRKPTLAGGVFCYKEPYLCFAANAFADEFRNAKFIHILRDGRDNADSIARTFPDTLSDFVLRDKLLAENKRPDVGPHREVRGHCVPWWVKPEDEEDFLAASPFGRCVYMWREVTLRGQELRKLGTERYLEIRYEDFVERPAETIARVFAFLGRSNAKSKKSRAAFNRSVGISARRQDPGKLTEANRIAGDLLRSLGYQTG
jgi:hypothetical protein